MFENVQKSVELEATAQIRRAVRSRARALRWLAEAVSDMERGEFFSNTTANNVPHLTAIELATAAIRSASDILLVNGATEDEIEEFVSSVSA